MQREIKFRGKRVDNGEWVHGNYFIDERDIEDGFIWREIPQIQQRYGDHYQYFDIINDTIGQYTGLKDKNGKEIYEEDIVKCTDANSKSEFIAAVEFGNPNGQYSWGFQLKHISGDKPNMDILLWIEMEETGAYCEVIGDIYTTPELLEVSE